MKIIITTALLFLSTISNLRAQKLEAKIPSDVDVVLMSNSENLFELISVSDIDNNMIGQEILRDLNRYKEQKATSVANLGFNIKSNAYYFYKSTDSISYHGVFMELNNRIEYEKSLSTSKLSERQTKNGVNYIKGYNDITVWNNDYFLMIKGDVSSAYFDENESLYENLEEGESKYDYIDKLESEWSEKFAFNIVIGNIDKSLVANKKFQKAKDKKASATFWVSDYGMLMSNVMSSFGGYMFSSLGMNAGEQNIYGVDEVVANLYFEKGNASVKLDMNVDSKMKKAFKKMYSTKMSSNLLSNLNTDDALGYLSFSVNTEEVLLQYPALVERIYGDLLPTMDMEIGVVTDLFSLVIDEKAIGDFITGDAIFVLDDLAKKEVEYTSYEYDDDYNRTETIGTKEEVVPDFTFMVGTKEEGLIEKMFSLGKKYEALSLLNENVYEFTELPNNTPFKMFALVKNEVLYVTTSKDKALNISKGVSVGKKTEDTKVIKKNSFVTYFNLNKTMSNFNEIPLSTHEQKIYDFANKNLKDVYLNFSKIKGNKITSELKLNTNGNQKNTLMLMLDFLNKVE